MPPPGAAPIASGMTVNYQKWTNAAAWVVANQTNPHVQQFCAVLSGGQPQQLSQTLQTIMSYMGNPMTQHEIDVVAALAQTQTQHVQQLMSLLTQALCTGQRAVHVTYTAPKPAAGGAPASAKQVTVTDPAGPQLALSV